MMRDSFGVYVLLSVVSFSFLATQALAIEEKQPLWELGVGGGAFSLPQYMGSDERYELPFAFPYIIYRGERWRIDREGVKNRVFDSKRLTLDVSLSGGLPVNNNNKAREGMPELLISGEIGPKLTYLISDHEQDDWRLQMPVRAVVNIRGKYTGWVATPHLNYNFHRDTENGILKGGFDLGVQANSVLYHQTYYDVTPDYATVNRPTYQSRGGLHSVFFKARIRYSINKDIEIFGAVQARTLNAGVVKDSPLVKKSFYGGAVLGFIWTFERSEEMVMSDVDL
ncbi:MAG: MipA/OmpV family protein [Ghiorsea sp.]